MFPGRCRRPRLRNSSVTIATAHNHSGTPRHQDNPDHGRPLPRLGHVPPHQRGAPTSILSAMVGSRVIRGR
jgi:hypothetical protein